MQAETSVGNRIGSNFWVTDSGLAGHVLLDGRCGGGVAWVLHLSSGFT